MKKFNSVLIREVYGDILIVLLMSLVVLSGCATMGLSSDPLLAAKQQGIIWGSVYNAEYKDVESVMNNKASTPEQITMANKKRAILVKVHPWLKMYKKATDKGNLPTTENTEALINLINELTVLSGDI